MSNHTLNVPKGWATCRVCRIEYPLIKTEHYVARETTAMGIASLAGGKEPQLYDAFDCPHCGCQNLFDRRLRSLKATKTNAEEFDENIERDMEDAPVCPYPKGGECYFKDTCSPECEFHIDHKEATD